MPNTSLEQLQQRWGIPGALEFKPGPGGQPHAQLTHGTSSATLALQGAHLISCQLTGGDDILWLSSTARHEAGTAIRGGIPLCWPWFGPHVSRDDRPQHGFARTSSFDVTDFKTHPQDGQLQLELSLATPALPEWLNNQGANLLSLRVNIDLGDELAVTLSCHNHGEESARISAALHTYFRVGDVRQVSVPALTGLHYQDKLDNYAEHYQHQPLTVNQAIDRVYQQAPASLTLLDPGRARQIHCQAWGHTDVVVWNPWQSGAAGMADFDDAGYVEMLCLEPAIAPENAVVIAPGADYQLGLRIHTSTLG